GPEHGKTVGGGGRGGGCGGGGGGPGGGSVYDKLVTAMALTIYNTLTRRKEPFVPQDDQRVTMYVCGPTVYDYPHIGHAKSYVSFDIIVRYLRHLGHDLLYVQNVTDVGHLTDDHDAGE